MSFLSPQKPLAPPSTPIAANSSVRDAGSRAMQGSLGYRSFVSTSSTGLKRKTGKSTIIGGA